MLLLLCCCCSGVAFFLHFFSQTTRSLVESDDSSVARRRRRSSRKPFVCRRRRRRFNLSADNNSSPSLSSIYFSTASERRSRRFALSFKNALCAHARFSPPFITPLAARTPSVSFQTTPKGRARLVDPSPIITYWEGDRGSRVSLGRTSNDRSYAVCAMRRGHSDDSRRHFVVHGYAVARPLA